MLLYSIVLFALAALIGLYMAARVFKGALPPAGAAVFHGLFAASGLVLLLYAAFFTAAAPSQLVTWAAILLVIAALGGFVTASFHMRGKVPPKALAAIHALVAVAGVGTLAVEVFNLA
jgi:protein-S-isoprenylcysteine O-methyltransferase Ste14